MFEITTKKTITSDDIDDVLVTALEGGINYWAVSAKPKDKDYKGADYASHCVSKGGILVIKTEEGEKHELNLENLKKGIEMYAEKHKETFESVDSIGFLDVEGADCIIQYALFGELVYG